jgi:hypothetical protein
LIQEQEQLKVAKLREEIEKQGYEIQALLTKKRKSSRKQKLSF